MPEIVDREKMNFLALAIGNNVNFRIPKLTLCIKETLVFRGKFSRRSNKIRVLGK